MVWVFLLGLLPAAPVAIVTARLLRRAPVALLIARDRWLYNAVLGGHRATGGANSAHGMIGASNFLRGPAQDGRQSIPANSRIPLGFHVD